MIAIVTYRQLWPAEFETIGKALRQALGSAALRIDHIGSTAVPGLPAKDIIDVQITVEKLEPRLERALQGLRFTRITGITSDHVPSGMTDTDGSWVKWLFKSPVNQRLTNVHVRIAGRPNQRYPLLFRDYLRVQPAIAQAYAQVKNALSKYHPEDMEAYYDVKDPVCDIIVGGAEVWATSVHWEAGITDC